MTKTTAYQDFIAPWSGESSPPPQATVPNLHFRWKNGVLQQLHSHPSGGRVRWWINVPVAKEDAPDVVPG